MNDLFFTPYFCNIMQRNEGSHTVSCKRWRGCGWIIVYHSFIFKYVNVNSWIHKAFFVTENCCHKQSKLVFLGFFLFAYCCHPSAHSLECSVCVFGHNYFSSLVKRFLALEQQASPPSPHHLQVNMNPHMGKWVCGQIV